MNRSPSESPARIFDPDRRNRFNTRFFGVNMFVVLIYFATGIREN